MAKYIILKDHNALWSRAPGATGTIKLVRRDGLPAPKLTVEDLSAGDIRDIARDLSVLSAARLMPTRLTEPEALDGFGVDDLDPEWALDATGASVSSATGAGARVCVLDTGIAAGHACFDGISLTSRDFTGKGLRDYHGHGTHSAGIVFGHTIGGRRVGVASGVAEAVIGKVLDDTGAGDTEAFFSGLLWAIDERADVILTSVELNAQAFARHLFDTEGVPERLAERLAARTQATTLLLFETLLDMISVERRPFLVMPAGNDSRRQISPEFEVSSVGLSRARHVLGVTALGPDLDGLALPPFANTGAALAAPGVGILSADGDGGLRILNGTSLAAAHVAGVAALWLSAQTPRPDTPSQWLLATLAQNATLHGLSGTLGPHDVGYGLVQAPA